MSEVQVSTQVRNAPAEPQLPPITPDLRLARPEDFMVPGLESFQPVPGAEQLLRWRTDVDKVSDGAFDVVIEKLKPGFERPVGAGAGAWHYHSSEDTRITYVIKGWFCVEHEGVGKVKLEAGSVHFGTPFNRHRVLDASDDLEFLVISSPARAGGGTHTLQFDGNGTYVGIKDSPAIGD